MWSSWWWKWMMGEKMRREKMMIRWWRKGEEGKERKNQRGERWVIVIIMIKGCNNFFLYLLHPVSHHCFFSLTSFFHPSSFLPSFSFLFVHIFSTEDGTYLETDREKKEYVMNEHGIIWRGVHNVMRPTPWIYGQVSRYTSSTFFLLSLFSLFFSGFSR